jgi:hypothetical protein
LKKWKWRLEALPWKNLSPNLAEKRTKDSKLFAMVCTTPGGMVHSSADLYTGQLLWCPKSKKAWADLAPQCIDTAASPEDALSTAIGCMDVKDLSYVERRYWEPEGPITPLDRCLKNSRVIHLGHQRADR